MFPFLYQLVTKRPVASCPFVPTNSLSLPSKAFGSQQVHAPSSSGFLLNTLSRIAFAASRSALPPTTSPFRTSARVTAVSIAVEKRAATIHENSEDLLIASSSAWRTASLWFNTAETPITTEKTSKTSPAVKSTILP